MGKFWGGMFGFRKSRKENKDEKQKIKIKINK